MNWPQRSPPTKAIEPDLLDARAGTRTVVIAGRSNTRRQTTIQNKTSPGSYPGPSLPQM